MSQSPVSQIRVQTTSKRGDSPQPRLPQFETFCGSNSAAPSSSHTATISTTSILQSRVSPSPMAAAGPPRAFVSVSLEPAAPCQVAVSPLLDAARAALLLTATSPALASAVERLFQSSKHTSIDVDLLAIEQHIDDLSGRDARTLAALLTRNIATLCAAAPQQLPRPVVSETGSPRRVHSPVSEHTEQVRSAMMRPSFAAAVVLGDQLTQSSSSNIPPLSPHAAPSACGTAAAHSAAPSCAATPIQSSVANGYALTFRPKQRRESIESFASQLITRRSIRNTTSIERSVDQDGFKTINDYSILRPLGRGASGKVKLAVHHDTNELRAIKIVKRSLVKKLQGPHGIERLRKEIAIMKKLNHKHVMKLYEVIDDPGSDKMYFVMQYAENGEVLPGIDELMAGNGVFPATLRPDESLPPCRPLPEDMVARYVRQAASALVYLHNRGIVHFDVKPQNMLLDADGNVVLADFGISELMHSDETNMVHCSGLGTPAFMAPEVISGERVIDGEAADTWSLGVTAFVMLYGAFPFVGSNMRDVFAAIAVADVAYPPCVTEAQKDFFSKIFIVDPKYRWTLRQLRQHDFLLCGSSLMSNSIMMLEEDNTASRHKSRAAVVLSQQDVEEAFSRLVTPVTSDLEIITSSCSRSASTTSPSRQSEASVSGDSAFSREQSLPYSASGQQLAIATGSALSGTPQSRPQSSVTTPSTTLPVPPSIGGTMYNPRNNMLHLIANEYVSPPMSRVASMSVSTERSPLRPREVNPSQTRDGSCDTVERERSIDMTRVRRETQVMKQQDLSNRNVCIEA